MENTHATICTSAIWKWLYHLIMVFIPVYQDRVPRAKCRPADHVKIMRTSYRFVGYIYLFSWHVIGIFIFLWFVINIFNFSWSVNRQLAVNCDCIVLFTVNGDCLSENPVNCYPNITRDTWFRLLSVKFCIRRIDQNVPMLMIFSQFFSGCMPP